MPFSNIGRVVVRGKEVVLATGDGLLLGTITEHEWIWTSEHLYETACTDLLLADPTLITTTEGLFKLEHNETTLISPISCSKIVKLP